MILKADSDALLQNKKYFCTQKKIEILLKTSPMENNVGKILLLDPKPDRLTGTERTDPSTNGQTLLRRN